ncbi:hypothetical protein BCR43DRAFT_289403 [Syncephalastrum racemosum]|uniref:Arrestin C-terminal-like domain-containing protein n=1 Tax=Syncephalastrum racemosum TaxID=13706 RepID=A0A1X2HES9_SYNRA|nr:hypothetical protein BCR43DRAFT_289403 [Syncephalastrum racemosum]
MRIGVKSSNTVSITLDEEKFYFPGEALKGTIALSGKVLVHPKSPTKANHVVLRFAGELAFDKKDKETTSLFNRSQILTVARDADTKPCVLEPRLHSFPFEFIVPEGLDLPSAMEFEKKIHIRYTLTAILDRPMVPEAFCSRAEYRVPILEYLDIEAPQFTKPQEMIANTKKHSLKALMPRVGFTRGDIVSLKVTLTTPSQFFSRKQGLQIQLVRIIDIQRSRHSVCKHSFLREHVLKSADYDLNLDRSNHFTQSIAHQMSIPTNTPPTIGYKGMLLRVFYQVRLRVPLRSAELALDMPIVIGTWPRADIPIEEDDEDDQDDASSTRSSRIPSSHSGASRLTNQRSSLVLGTRDVDRSDSKSSRGSAASWRSSEPALSRNTSQSTGITMPEPRPLNAPSATKMPLPSCASSYSLSLRTSPPLPPQPQSIPHTATAYRQSLPPMPLSSAVLPRPFHPISEPPIPNHILQPVPQSAPPSTCTASAVSTSTPATPTTYHIAVDSDDDDSDDEDDLLRIVEKKKRAELKRQQQQQQQQQPVGVQ